MQPFDPINSPLQGLSLIEAGAGTGKTYTITTLVLRLLLQKGLAAEQILIVTFTTAATAELRDRVRRRLQTARQALHGQTVHDPELEQLLAVCGAWETARARVDDALTNFDRMPVFTIHGFCQRVLHEMAFETGSAFDAELVTDSTDIVQSLSDDFWRKAWTASPPELIRYAWQKMKSPDHLAAMYRRYAFPQLDIHPEETARALPSLEPFRERWRLTRQQWRQHRDRVGHLLMSPDLKANIYGRSDPAAAGGSRPSAREAKIHNWRQKMDRWARAMVCGFPLPDVLLYFTSGKLAKSVKKGTKGPRHAFFDLCDQLWEDAGRLEGEMQQWLVGSQVGYFRFMQEALDQYKQEKQRLFFDDLLVRVRDALHQEGGDLKRMLQTRYRAVLIDEFQDTDAIQYDIFNTLFGGGHLLMFLIGDPKQAIYSFRGADIFSYLHAARHVRRRYTLTRNWRSTPDMVHAVNALFGHGPQPFVWSDIVYHPATAAQDQVAKASSSGQPPSLTVWFLDNPSASPGGRRLTKQTATNLILDAVAREVHELRAGSGSGKEALAYRDLAVLVRTNRQAREVKRRLSEAAIPAVVYNAGSVFHQAEALDLRRLLEGVADPGHEGKLRTALTTPFIGRQGAELAFEAATPDWWTAIVDRFFAYRDLWHENGFMRMFRRLAVEENIAARLLGEPAGERYLTNTLHLVELLHRASTERPLGVAELIQWLDRQRRQTNDTAEAHQMRLESDDDAVTIMTVHKSKGLEFPIVLCPFTWEGSAPPSSPALCQHDDRIGFRLLDLGSDAMDRHLAKMAEEQMAEELRLLYVAVTRAKQRVYLVWGPLPSVEYSALAYLVADMPETAAPHTFQERSQTIATALQDADGDGYRKPVEALARRAAGPIAVVDLPDKAPWSPPGEPPPPSVLKARRFRRKPMPAWKIASFSSLISKRRDDGEIREDGMEGEDHRPETLHVTVAQGPSRHIGDMARFEAGPRTGIFLHDILEKIDFSLPGRPNWEGAIEERMRVHGIDGRWQNAIRAMMERVVRAPLDMGTANPFALEQVSPAHRLNELEFHLPMRAVDAAALERVFAGCRSPALRGKLAGLLERLAFSLSGGYLKGFIDLVFRHEGRFFIADWKSNHLGDSFDAYHADRLADVVAQDFYFLQYHIYVLALDRYLRSSCHGYAYEKDFGGVYYLFIRGMGPPSGPSTGVFFDRPEQELINKLEQAILL